jgi:23S rRNA (guanosine2251-2'-O)-methyltransferase
MAPSRRESAVVKRAPETSRHRSARGAGRDKRRPRRERAVHAQCELIYGLHAAEEALRNPKRGIRRLLVTENALRRLAPPPAGVSPQIVAPRDIASLLPVDAVHQGVLVEAAPLPWPSLDELAGKGVLIALDQITDPHNVGAILRTAAAFAVAAAIVPIRHSPAMSGVLAKAASGALEHVPLVAVRNLAEALIELGERGYLRVGLDSQAAPTLEDAPLRDPLVLVLGAEGKGLRERVRQCCDLMVRIDLPGAITSLNVSNAAAIALSVVNRAVGTASR